MTFKSSVDQNLYVKTSISTIKTVMLIEYLLNFSIDFFPLNPHIYCQSGSSAIDLFTISKIRREIRKHSPVKLELAIRSMTLKMHSRLDLHKCKLIDIDSIDPSKILLAEKMSIMRCTKRLKLPESRYSSFARNRELITHAFKGT
ncbi:hypothetical protein GJ496_002972 [Pomphorhynchus laevis]|nr:hypothetical protein GJ496_002972 [Pomphorhynchus laevis]